jgi:sporulation protein YlmC with PRC-barrel domain
MGVVEETRVFESRDFLPTTLIKGATVVNAKDEKLGKIEEIMIDSERGRIAYAVIASDCFLGMSCKLFAIPWESLERNRDDYILRVDKSVLENSPGIDEDAWSLTRGELADVYKRCGIQPYWDSNIMAKKATLRRTSVKIQLHNKYVRCAIRNTLQQWLIQKKIKIDNNDVVGKPTVWFL